jgi:MFS family permease
MRRPALRMHAMVRRNGAVGKGGRRVGPAARCDWHFASCVRYVHEASTDAGQRVRAHGLYARFEPDTAGRLMRAPLLRGPFLFTTVANFFFFMSFASYFLLPLHVRALGGSESQIGAVMGASGLASLAILPLVAISIDRLGRRFFLMIGALGMTVASCGFVFVRSVGPLLFACRLLQGLSFAAAFTATTTFAAEFAPIGRRAQALGVFGLSTLLTHAFAPIIGEEIVHRAGFRALFGVTFAYTAVASVVALWLPAANPVEARTARADERRLRPAHWMVAATMTCAGMGFGTVMTFIATYVTEQQLGRVGLFFAAYTATAIMTRLVGAGVSDRVGRRRVILPTLAALALSIYGIALVRSVPALIAAGALFGTAQGISYPTLHAFLVDLATEAQLGRSQALFNGAFNFGVTCSAFAFGIVAEHFGYRTMFAVAAAMPLIGCGVFAAGTRGIAQ